MDILNLFSSNIRRIRKDRGLTQEELADACGMHRTYISAIERGKRSISLNNISKIAASLQVEPYELFMPLIEEGTKRDIQS